jgi:flavin reductase (DIM6/NTAB) family NADH-FMN oxidoreductase RutF
MFGSQIKSLKLLRKTKIRRKSKVLTMAREKEEIRIRPFWYSDIWIFPKLITIITTLDEQGRVNAAPYSHIMQWDVMQKRPRLIMGCRQESHTYENILATGEFVVNCPSADNLDDMMETARFWPEGVNELDHTGFTPIPSRKVKPPSLEECPQIAECTVDQIIRLDKSSGLVIANIEAIVMDKGLEQMDRSERIPAMNLPVGLGDQSRRYYYHAHTDNVTMHELMEPPGAQKGGKIAMTMPWDEDAVAALMGIPVAVRKMVSERLEEYATEKGEKTVRAEHMKAMGEEYGIDSELLERFRT